MSNHQCVWQIGSDNMNSTSTWLSNFFLSKPVKFDREGMLSQLNDSSVLKQPKYTCISLTFLEQKKMVVIFLWLLPPMEAKPYCCPVEWVRVAKKYQLLLCPQWVLQSFLSLTLGFGLFWNIFGCSMLSDNFFESDLIVHLLVYYRRK